MDNSEPISSPVVLKIDEKEYHNIYLPAKVRVKRGLKSTTITAKAQGYSDGKIVVNKKFNPVSMLNLINPVAWCIDLATGAITKPDSKYYTMNMQQKNYVEKPQEIVSRKKQDATSLEKTIIRWYFESQPQGARIFWRVISSVPEEVKNTNENWLGNTPFEETRSFNILGLTYDNANDVQIEIKVRRQGYLDQTKRFNVRQAIDQQEISAFFDMIKAEE